MKKKSVFLAVLAMSVLAMFAKLPYSHSQEVPASVRRTVNYNIPRYSSDPSMFLLGFFAYHPSVFTFVNSDGSVAVCVSDDNAKMTHIYEYTADLAEQRTFTFRNELDVLGAFTKDSDGNYYFFYGKEAVSKTDNNMAMVKYDRNGNRVRTFMLAAGAPNSYEGIQNPFQSSTCRLEISGNMLAVYFGRRMFPSSDGFRHQSSYGFVLNKDTFARVDLGAAYNSKLSGDMRIPYVSHSFNQFILPVRDGFVFVDHGDGAPRAFSFAKFQNGKNTDRLNGFRFPGEDGSNATYSEMGGLAKTSNGYIFAFTYAPEDNYPLNLFIHTFDDNLQTFTTPVFYTNYTEKNEYLHVGHPKIIGLDSGKYLLMWEVFTYIGRTGHVSTHLLIIDERGSRLSEIMRVQARLSMIDVPRYNSRNKKVYWAVNDSPNSIVTYALDIGKLSASAVRPLPAAALQLPAHAVPPPIAPLTPPAPAEPAEPRTIIKPTKTK